MVQIYTAQYKYSGNDRLDITVKGKDPIGKVFAPTWKMVMGSKEGKVSWPEYECMYKDLMRKSYQKHWDIWEQIMKRDEVTFVCLCK